MIFSKYFKIYNQIIDNRISNPLNFDEYGEHHHIIPKSLGGDDNTTNIVKLSAREHYLCHYLLTKFLENEQKHKMIYAFNMMNFSSETHSRVFNSLLYENNKKKMSIIRSNEMQGSKNPCFNFLY